MSSNIPLARDILKDVATKLRLGVITERQAAAAITRALPLLVRKKASRRAQPKKYMTQRLRRQIKGMARDNPRAHLDDIAAHFGVNVGRVSEVLAGK